MSDNFAIIHIVPIYWSEVKLRQHGGSLFAVSLF